MTVFLSLPVLLGLAIILVLHILSQRLSELYGKIALFVNIALHIAMFVVLAFLGASADEVVLFFMCSVFLYTLVALIKAKGVRREEK